MSTAGSGREGLGRRSITAMLWGAGGSLLRILLQLVSQIVLARLLGPEAFGIFAVALVVVLFSSLLADVGLAYGLIQKPSVSDEDVRFVFTWQALLGLLTTAAVYVAAPWIAGLYADPRLQGVIRALAIGCLLNALAATPACLLKRELDFRALNIAAVASYAVGFLAIGIPLALAGAGVVALVAAYLAQAAVLAGLQYAQVRHSVRPLLWQPGAPGMLDFGAMVLATNLLNWVMNGIDRAIAGSSLGLAAAGLYATAFNLISTPLINVLSLLQSVFYSASSKVQDEPAQLRRGLATLLGAVMLFVAPVFVAIAAAADTLFLALYGLKWAGGGAVLAPLALAMPAFLMMGLATPVLWASGQTRREFQLQVPIALVWMLVLWAVARWGSLAGLGWSVAGLFLIRAGVIIGATLAAISMPWSAVGRACAPGALVSLLVGLAAFACDRWLGQVFGPGWRLLALDVLASGAALAIGLRLLGPAVSDDLAHMLRQLADRLPAGLGSRALRLVMGL